jgi:hypothetical protein
MALKSIIRGGGNVIVDCTGDRSDMSNWKVVISRAGHSIYGHPMGDILCQTEKDVECVLREKIEEGFIDLEVKDYMDCL